MRALIVDDDIFSIKGLLKGVKWQEDGIDEVEQATQTDAARQIIEAKQVDIIICDIEMPDESGIELLQWIRDREYSPLFIFYSCHADFHYAQTAVKLQVFDYILKPAPYTEIDQVLVKAVGERRMRIEKASIQKYNIKKEIALREKFVNAILDGTIPDTTQQIDKMQTMLSLQLPEGKSVYCILHDIKDWDKILESWVKIDVEFSIKNVVREIFNSNDLEVFVIIPIYEKYYLTILQEKNVLRSLDDVKERCRHLNVVFKKLTGYGMNSFVSERISIYEISKRVKSLRELSWKNNNRSDDVCSETELRDMSDDFQEGNVDNYINTCYSEILRGNRKALSQAVEQLFEFVEKRGINGYYSLEMINHKYERMIFSVLEIKNINVFQFTNDSVYQNNRERALWGRGYLKMHISYMNEMVLDILYKAVNEGDVINEVKKYIEIHVGEDISREDLSDVFFLNKDYLSRLFKKKEKISLTQYIINCKIDKAKRLLEIPEVSVTSAGESIGIFNYSYFSRLFKKEVGVSPSEYKKMCQNS